MSYSPIVLMLGLANVLLMFCFICIILYHLPESKVHGANTGPIWGRQDPGGPHVGPMKFALWASLLP